MSITDPTDITIADRDTVRIRSGNQPRERLPDAVIDAAIKESDDFVRDATQNHYWAPTDPAWNSVKGASELIAASLIRFQFNDDIDRAKAQYNMALSMIDKILKNVAPGGGGSGGAAGATDTIMRSAAYQSYPLNPYASFDEDGEGAAFV